VDRAVEYAYETRRQFPDRRLFLVGEIIHNPHVNLKLISMGVTILGRAGAEFDFSAITPEDVVIMPAPAARCSTSGSGSRATPAMASPP